MLEPILQTLRDIEGVQGAMVVDRASAVIAQRAHAVYDLQVLQQVARSVITTADSIQLVQDDWDVLSAHFADGKLLLRNLRVGGARPQRYILAVIADARLNVAFLGVALRVAATKLTAELEAGPPSGQSGQTGPGGASGANASMPPSFSTQGGRSNVAEGSRSELSKSGLSWSGVGSSSDIGVTSDVGVLDTASSTFLTACTKALASAVGPMAKVFVKEAVRKLCGERPFSRADAPALLAHLTSKIDDADDRTAFQRATRAL